MWLSPHPLGQFPEGGSLLNVQCDLRSLNGVLFVHHLNGAVLRDPLQQQVARERA